MCMSNVEFHLQEESTMHEQPDHRRWFHEDGAPRSKERAQTQMATGGRCPTAADESDAQAHDDTQTMHLELMPLGRLVIFITP